MIAATLSNSMADHRPHDQSDCDQSRDLDKPLKDNVGDAQGVDVAAPRALTLEWQQRLPTDPTSSRAHRRRFRVCGINGAGEGTEHPPVGLHISNYRRFGELAASPKPQMRWAFGNRR